MKSLPVAELFRSIQGEGPETGLPTTFLRLVGCPLRCVWCDSEWAFSGGSLWSEQKIMDEIRREALPGFCLTGGEPLIHKRVPELLKQVLQVEDISQVSVETSGAEPLDLIPAGVRKTVDWKAPSSGAGESFLEANLAFMGPGDCLKFVVAESADLPWLLNLYHQYGLVHLGCDLRVHVAQGTGLSVPAVADWLITEGLTMHLGVQLHKLLWPGVHQGV